MKISIKMIYIRCLSLLYLYIPIWIFFVTWTKWWIAAAAIAVSGYSCLIIIKSYKKDVQSGDNHGVISIGVLPLMIVTVSILFMGIISGWGGWMVQSWDWLKHNAILSDLVTRDWPVYYREAVSPSMLTYYVGQYLIPAIVGKVLGSFRVAEIMMYIWGEIGVFLVALNLFHITHADSFVRQGKLVLVLLFFSGCLIISQILFFACSLIVGQTVYSELPAVLFRNVQWMSNIQDAYLQYRSNYVDLRWVMPQTIAVWLVVTLWCDSHRDIYYYVPMMLPAMLNGAISFLCLAVMAVICAIYEQIVERRTVLKFLKDIFSLPNLLSLVAIGLPLLAYYSGNVFAPKVDVVGFHMQHLGLKLYMSFCIGHFGIYALMTWRRHWKKGIFISAFILLILLPSFSMGYYNDLAMSGSIPAMFVMMICVIDVLFNNPRRLTAVVLSICLLIAAINPFREMVDVIKKTYDQKETNSQDITTLLQTNSDLSSGDISWRYNYYSYNIDDNVFIKYVARKGWE